MIIKKTLTHSFFIFHRFFEDVWRGIGDFFGGCTSEEDNSAPQCEIPCCNGFSLSSNGRMCVDPDAVNPTPNPRESSTQSLHLEPLVEGRNVESNNQNINGWYTTGTTQGARVTPSTRITTTVPSWLWAFFQKKK